MRDSSTENAFVEELNVIKLGKDVPSLYAAVYAKGPQTPIDSVQSAKVIESLRVENV
jgi:hypothetical protein